jgi:hypothetical protein
VSPWCLVERNRRHPKPIASRSAARRKICGSLPARRPAPPGPVRHHGRHRHAADGRVKAVSGAGIDCHPQHMSIRLHDIPPACAACRRGPVVVVADQDQRVGFERSAWHRQHPWQILDGEPAVGAICRPQRSKLEIDCGERRRDASPIQQIRFVPPRLRRFGAGYGPTEMLERLAHPARFELTTSAFGGQQIALYLGIPRFSVLD